MYESYEAIRTILPEKFKENSIGDREDTVKFKNYGNSFAHPFWCTADFESILEKPQQEQEIILDDVVNHPKGTSQKHLVNSCGIKYNCIHDM